LSACAVPRPECVRCLLVHGRDPRHGAFPCVASQTGEKGEAICVWCADGLPCPFQLRRLAQTKASLRLLSHISANPSISGFAVPLAMPPRVPAPEVVRSQLMQRSQEDHIMPETHSAQPSRTTSIAPAARTKTQPVKGAVPQTATGRTCATPGCKRVLALNNTSGVCRECGDRQGRSHSKKTNGHGLQLARRDTEPTERAQVLMHVSSPTTPELAKPNGHAPHGNGGGPGATNVESRVDLLLAAIPAEDKAKMLSAWLAGTL
jgi:hypothetical protein